MKSNTKKYLIYARYVLPIFAHLVTFIMLFVPSFRFIFSGKAGELMSVATLISNSWEQAREVLFGTAEQTDAAMIFSRTLFIMIIVVVILFLISLFISAWTAIVAFKCFLSDDEENAEKSRLTLTVFVPNRIVLCIYSALGLIISSLPYLMNPLYAFTYSQKVTPVLEAPDALIVGGVLFVATCVLSVVCSFIEKSFEADIFAKQKDESDDEYYDDRDEDDNSGYDVDSEARERIRRLFDENKKDK